MICKSLKALNPEYIEKGVRTMSEMEHGNKTVVSAEGLRQMEEKLQYMKTVRRAEVAEHLNIARGFGDLSENAEYDEAKDEQAKLEADIIELYRHGITTREIADLIEKMYGQFYTPQTVSNISRAVEEQVETFHSRPVSDRYSVIFCDATYLNVRRDSVAKEALHILIGITPDGTKELLDFALYPTESAENYKEMLNGLKERGVQQVLLFVTDGLKGLKSAVLEAFPAARYQSCWTHICRNVMKHIRAKDKRSVMDDLKKVYSAATRDDAISALHDFFEKYHKIYPKVIDILNDLEDLFTYYAFPKAIQRSIYTTNLIENFNKNLKRGTKAKEQFPNEDALERYVCSYCMDYNRRFSMRIHKGFQIAQAELMEMFRQ